MIDRELFKTDTPPFCIHVIGFGQNVESVISGVSDLGYDGVAAYMADAHQVIVPGEKDIMAILCVEEREDASLKVSKTFYDANILTLIVSTKPLNGAIFDSISIVNLEDMAAVVKNLLDPIFLQSRICFDFNDMAMGLKNSRNFIVENAIGKGENRVKDALRKLAASVAENRLDTAGCLLLMIYFNPGIEPPLMMRELVPLNDYLGTLPDNINVVWAISHDDKMVKEAIRLSALISGKNRNHDVAL